MIRQQTLIANNTNTHSPFYGLPVKHDTGRLNNGSFRNLLTGHIMPTDLTLAVFAS